MRINRLLSLFLVVLLAACGEQDGSASADSSEMKIVSAASTGYPEGFFANPPRTLAKNGDLDTDGDGVPDSSDAFPNNPGEFIDSDGDGVGNFAQLDEDLDSVPDLQDAFPFDDTRSELPELLETEPNEATTSSSISLQSLPMRIRGTLSGPSDMDFFQRPTPPASNSLWRITYKATSSSIVKIDIFSEDGAERSLGDRVWRIPGSSVESSIFHQAIVGMDYFMPNPEVNYLRVTPDIGASFPQAYEILVYADHDMDLVPDDLETAIGARNDLIYSADTRIPDFVKVNVAIQSGISDRDSDGIPDWLDLDSDGDSFPDVFEGYDDVDRDTLPNYADLDSDGNTVSDAIDCAPISGQCIDSDGDGLENWRDIDDDADSVIDVYDINGLVPVQVVSSFAVGRPALLEAHSLVDGRLASQVARSGSTLILAGASLEALGTNPIVSFASNSGVASEVRGELRNIRGQFTSGELHVPFEWNTPGEIRVFVTDGAQATQAVSITALPQSAPMLADASASFVNSQVQLVVTGDKIPLDANLLVDGASVPIATRIGTTQVTANLPAVQKEGAVQIISSAGASNIAPYRVSVGKRARIQYPSGYSLAYSNLSVLSDSLQEATPTVLGQADITVSTSCTHVMVSGIPVQDQAATVFSGFVAPLDYLPPINAETTAIAYAFIPLLVMGSVTAEEVCALRAQAASLPEMQALQQLIANRLAVQKELPNFTRLINLAYLRSAANAAAVLVKQSRGSSSSSSPPSYLTAKSGPEYAPVFSPATQYDVTPFATKIAGSTSFDGKVNFTNDTRVFYSAQAKDSVTGVIYNAHVTGWMDPLLIQPQQGLVYLLGPYDAGGRKRPVDINFADVDLELIKSFAGISSADAAVYAATRTIFQQVMTPWLSAILGLPKYAAFDVASGVLIYYPAVHSSFNAAVKNKDYLLAQDLILDQIADDFVSFGPISRALGSRFLRSPQIAGSILGKRMIPYLNGALLAMDLGSAAVDTAVTLKDMANIPGKLEYQVNWPMWIESTEITSDPADAATWSSLLVIKGYGFRTKTPSGGDARLHMLAFVSGTETHLIDPSKVAPNGRSMAFHASEEFWGFGGTQPVFGDTLSITIRRDTDTFGRKEESNTKDFTYQVVKATALCPGTGVGAFWLVGWEFLFTPVDFRTGANQTSAFSGCVPLTAEYGW